MPDGETKCRVAKTVQVFFKEYSRVVSLEGGHPRGAPPECRIFFNSKEVILLQVKPLHSKNLHVTMTKYVKIT